MSTKSSIAVIILAAGKGTRMRVDHPKCAVSTIDRPMIEHVLSATALLRPKKTVVVSGYMRDILEDVVVNSGIELNVEFAHQVEQRGTGDAVKAAMPHLNTFSGTTLIICGDTPLITPETLERIIHIHQESKATLSIITATEVRQNAYGRMIRDKDGKVIRIVETKDCSAEELKITEINAAIYAVDCAFLQSAIQKLEPKNAQNEYYLTDIVNTAVREGKTISTYTVPEISEVQGVNDRYDLSLVNRTIMDTRIKELITQGVTFIDPQSAFIDKDVVISEGAVIGPQVQLRGKTKIASGVIIDGTAIITDSEIKKDAHLRLGICIDKSTVGERCSVGPFAHIREGAVIESEVKIGNFVEVKKSLLHQGVKASHLTYLGDAEVGENTNIGAGTITCNYDGVKKSKTTIGKNVFVGSNSSLVAPVTINDGATIGAGSVITSEVGKDALAVTRAPLTVKPDWSKKRRGLKEK